MGISGCVLRTHGCGPFLVSQEFTFRRSSQLYTAVNIYLLLGLLWATFYLAIDAAERMRHLIAHFDAGPKSASRKSPLMSSKSVSGPEAKL
jgi:hypothetical protein